MLRRALAPDYALFEKALELNRCARAAAPPVSMARHASSGVSCNWAAAANCWNKGCAAPSLRTEGTPSRLPTPLSGRRGDGLSALAARQPTPTRCAVPLRRAESRTHVAADGATRRLRASPGGF